MSYSSADVASQAKDISAIAKVVPQCSLALSTNKRAVICCLSIIAARELKLVLTRAGYFSEVAKGLVSDRQYVCAYFNNPY